MLVYFTEAKTNKTVAVNPNHVISVFGVTEGEFEGKTAIVFVGGNLAVEEPLYDAVGLINANINRKY